MTQPILPNQPYGTDIGCFFTSTGVGDLSPGAVEVTGLQLVAQRILCRITTRRGTVIDAPNDCLDIRDYCRAGNTVQNLSAIRSELQAEIAKEQAVQSVSVQVTFNLELGTMQIVLAIVAGSGPFTLTLSVSSLTVQILAPHVRAKK